jgi:hypothetical protein
MPLRFEELMGFRKISVGRAAKKGTDRSVHQEGLAVREEFLSGT